MHYFLDLNNTYFHFIQSAILNLLDVLIMYFIKLSYKTIISLKNMLNLKYRIRVIRVLLNPLHSYNFYSVIFVFTIIFSLKPYLQFIPNPEIPNTYFIGIYDECNDPPNKKNLKINDTDLIDTHKSKMVYQLPDAF